jgi:hypothetical protein
MSKHDSNPKLIDRIPNTGESARKNKNFLKFLSYLYFLAKKTFDQDPESGSGSASRESS